MYEYISGKVAHKGANFIVIEAGGIGYRLFADAFTINSLKSGEDAKIYTHLKVAEDEMSLYGFYSVEQRAMFEKLISISGVGPKVGVSVLSTLKTNDIAAAVISNDPKAFEAAPGVGKKMAQRLVLELKEKVDFSQAVGEGIDMADFAAEADAVSEACAALCGLGYNRQEAMVAVAAVKNLGDTAEELVGLALKRIGK